MAHFKGSIQGYREFVSTIGNKNTGLVVRADGWKSGVLVRASYDSMIRKNVFEIFSTGGREGAKTILIQRILENDPFTVLESKPSIPTTTRLGVKTRRKDRVILKKRHRRPSLVVIKEQLEKLKAREQHLEEVVREKQGKLNEAMHHEDQPYKSPYQQGQ